MPNKSIGELIAYGASLLRNITHIPRKECIILLSYATKLDTAFIMANPKLQIDNCKLYLEYIKRRADHEPIEYITNSVEFYSQSFYIDNRVLIPRPESEILVDKVIEKLPKNANFNFAEVGVGSGVLSITLARHFKNSTFIATDISEDALDVARLNIDRYNLIISLLKTDILDGIDENIDVIVSNPPYIKNDATLDKNIYYEPKIALFGGISGVEILIKIINEFMEKDSKYLFCEIGYDQKEYIKKHCAKLSIRQIEFYKDLSSLYRGFTIFK